MKHAFRTLALLALLAGSTAADATIYRYTVDFDGALSGDKGKGEFSWNDVTLTVSQFSWEFGVGDHGGLDDSVINWMQPLYGGTRSTWLFEVLTGQNVHPFDCGGMTGCVADFSSSSVLGDEIYGFPFYGVGFSAGGIGEVGGFGPRMYQFNNSDPVNASYDHWGYFRVTKIDEAEVPEPATLALFGMGLAGLGLSRRRKA